MAYFINNAYQGFLMSLFTEYLKFFLHIH